MIIKSISGQITLKINNLMSRFGFNQLNTSALSFLHFPLLSNSSLLFSNHETTSGGVINIFRGETQLFLSGGFVLLTVGFAFVVLAVA